MNQELRMPAYIPLTLKIHEYPSGFRSKPSVCKRPAIIFIEQGEGTIYINQARYTLHAGAIAFLHPTDHYHLAVNSGSLLQLHLLHYYSLHIKLSQNAALTTEASSPPNLTGGQAVLPATSVLVHTLIFKLKRMMDKNNEQGLLQRQMVLYELMVQIHCLLEFSTQSFQDPGESISKTIAYMEEHYSEPISLKELPLLAGMTQSSYCRAFKKLTGMTPGQYLTRFRMIRAKELMMNRQSTLREIAVQVGYQDELYFSRIFKKSEGMSPSSYIQRKDKKVAVVSRYLLQDHLLALGIQPVAAPAYPGYYHTPSGFPSYLHDRLQGTYPLHAGRPISSHDVLKLSPDLIFETRQLSDRNDWDGNAEGTTLIIDPATGWEQYLRDIARRLNKKSAAERLIRRMLVLEQQAKASLYPLTQQGTWAVVRLYQGDCRLYGVKEHAFTELFYQRLQFHPGRIDHSHYVSHAIDRLAAMNPDNILVLWSEPEEIQAFQAKKIWQRLSAVQNNRVYVPDSREWDPWGPIGREWMIRSMLRYFKTFVTEKHTMNSK